MERILMNKKSWLSLILCVALGSIIYGHCQIPCGIYDDKRIISELFEHEATIKKSIQAIENLRNEPELNSNQLTRWVVNKENHATKIQFLMNDYFLAQRIKFASQQKDEKKYIQLLKAAHQVIFYAMKVKQSSDLSTTVKLKEALENFESSYN